jgi:hypothetical protein
MDEFPIRDYAPMGPRGRSGSDDNFRMDANLPKIFGFRWAFRVVTCTVCAFIGTYPNMSTANWLPRTRGEGLEP